MFWYIKVTITLRATKISGEVVGRLEDFGTPRRRRFAGAEDGPRVSSAHASTASATASLYFLSALYCSAFPPRWILLQICLWPRRQWSCWQVALQ